MPDAACAPSTAGSQMAVPLALWSLVDRRGRPTPWNLRVLRCPLCATAHNQTSWGFRLLMHADTTMILHLVCTCLAALRVTVESENMHVVVFSACNPPAREPGMRCTEHVDQPVLSAKLRALVDRMRELGASLQRTTVHALRRAHPVTTAALLDMALARLADVPSDEDPARLGGVRGIAACREAEGHLLQEIARAVGQLPAVSLDATVSPAGVLESLGDLAQSIFCMACADRLELTLTRLHVGLWCGGYGHRCGARPGSMRRITVWAARSPNGDEFQISDRVDEEEEEETLSEVAGS